MCKIKSFIIPSAAQLFFLTFFVALLFNDYALLRDGDTGYHIKTGEYILQNLSVPSKDIFSYITPALPWTAHEWLSEVVMAKIHDVLGLSGVVVLFAALIALSFTILFKFLQTDSDYRNIILVWPVTFLATLCTSVHWMARPHVFSFFFLVVWYYILNMNEYKSKNYLCFLPLIMLFWVNMHGGYIIGFILLGVYFISNLISLYFVDNEKSGRFKKNTKNYFLIGMACFVIALINPAGYKIFLFPFNLVSNKFLMANIVEFMPTNIQMHYLFRYFLFFSLTVLFLSKKRTSLIETILVLLFTYMSLYSLRYTSLFPIIVTPIILKRIEFYVSNVNSNNIALSLTKKIFKFRSKKIDTRGCIWPIVIFSITIFAVDKGYISYNFDSNKKPVEAVDFLLTEYVSGNMFNNDEFGDYLIYKGSSIYKVFIDGRSDMYGTEHLKNYLRVVRLKNNWEKVIKDYDIGWIFYKADSLLSRYLLERSDWHLIYADRVAHIYVKKTDEYKSLIKKYPKVEPVVYKQ